MAEDTHYILAVGSDPHLSSIVQHRSDVYACDSVRMEDEFGLPTPVIERRCWWDHHPYTGPTVTIPMKIKYGGPKPIVYTEGFFCSWNCKKAYLKAYGRTPYYNNCDSLDARLYEMVPCSIRCARAVKSTMDPPPAELILPPKRLYVAPTLAQKTSDLMEEQKLQMIWGAMDDETHGSALLGRRYDQIPLAPSWKLLEAYGGPMSIDEFRREFVHEDPIMEGMVVCPVQHFFRSASMTAPLIF